MKRKLLISQISIHFLHRSFKLVPTHLGWIPFVWISPNHILKIVKNLSLGSRSAGFLGMFWLHSNKGQSPVFCNSFHIMPVSGGGGQTILHAWASVWPSLLQMFTLISPCEASIKSIVSWIQRCCNMGKSCSDPRADLGVVQELYMSKGKQGGVLEFAQTFKSRAWVAEVYCHWCNGIFFFA